MTRAGMLAIGGGFDALVTHAMHFERARRSLEADLGAERALREHGGDLARELERVARDRVALGSQRSAMDAARLAMQDEERRRTAFDRAFQASSGASDYVAVYGGASAEPGRRASLRELEGAAPLPRHRQGRRSRRATRGDGRPRARGARTDGRRRTRRLRREGRVRGSLRRVRPHRDPRPRRPLLLRQRQPLGASTSALGDEITAGERLGTVGDDGQGPMLYFEIRHGDRDTASRAPGSGI